MKIEFLCDTSEYCPYINGAHFILKDGREVLIDRYLTEYGRNYYDKFEMDFIDCYIWDGEKEIPITEEEFKGAHFVRFEVEDDAPLGYYIQALEVNGESVTDYDKRIDILGNSDGTPYTKIILSGFLNHLDCNNYNYDLYKENIILVNQDDVAYYETMLQERGLSYAISENNCI